MSTVIASPTRGKIGKRFWQQLFAPCVWCGYTVDVMYNGKLICLNPLCRAEWTLTGRPLRRSKNGRLDI